MKESSEPFYDPRRASPWPRPPLRTRLISPEELRGWVLHDGPEVLALNKPGDVVCHPSKAGPWSSLSGAVKACMGLQAAHLVQRLDRETSGVVIFAKNAASAARLQEAVRLRRPAKTYLAVLTGELTGPVTVDQPLGDDEASPVLAKAAVRPDGKPALTRFVPVSAGGGFTLAEVFTGTGRKHQIRAHAQWLGKSLVGDKIYGPDPRCFLDFIAGGWTPALAEKLLLPRQALHCLEIDMSEAGAGKFRAPLPADMSEFCRSRGLALPD